MPVSFSVTRARHPATPIIREESQYQAGRNNWGCAYVSDADHGRGGLHLAAAEERDLLALAAPERKVGRSGRRGIVAHAALVAVCDDEIRDVDAWDGPDSGRAGRDGQWQRRRVGEGWCCNEREGNGRVGEG